MDDRLALRLQLFRETGQVRPEVADFVTAELQGLADEGLPVTEESAGMLTSHLMMALDRLQKGESVGASEADDQMRAELADHPRALERSREVGARARTALGLQLPDSELNYLAMHLAVLAQRSGGAAPTAPGGAAD